MIKETLKALAKIQDRYPILVILLVLTLTAFFGYYAVRIETDSSFNVMMREDSQGRTMERLLDAEFGGTDTLFVLAQIDADINDKTRVQDIRDPGVIKGLSELQRSLESETFVASTFSLANLFNMVYGRLPETLEESKQMIADFPPDIRDVYVGRFLSDDFNYQVIIVSVSVEDTPGFLQKIEDNAREKISQTPLPIGVKADLSGMPPLMNRILKYLINDNLITFVYAMIAVVIVLWIYFRSWRIAVFSAIPTIITLTWLAGTMYMIDMRITLMTASVGAMMIGISVDYAIHLTHRYHQGVQEGRKDPVEDTVVGIGAALFASVVTTIAGFLAMLLGLSPNSQTQGTVLAIGVAYAFIVSMLLLPPLMKLQRKHLYSKVDEALFKIIGRRETKRTGLINKFLAGLAGLQVRRPFFVVGLVVLGTILIIPGFAFVYTDFEGENWIPEGDDIFEGLMVIGTNFGGIDSMNLIFMADKSDEDYDPNFVHDLRDPRVMLPMASLDDVIRDIRWVDAVDSPSYDITNKLGRMPREFEEIKSIINENPDIRSKYNDDFSLVMYTLVFDGINRERYYELLREMDSVEFPKEVSVVPQGSVPEDIEFEQVMLGDTNKTTIVGFLFVIIIASLFYRSIVSGFLAFIPIIFAIIFTVGFMGYIDLPFNVLTTGMLAILMGMGIDFSIHLIHSIEEGMEEYKGDASKAFPHALTSTGQAISITTITTILGFLALSFATLVNTHRLGYTLAIGIGATFIACIIIVPTVLSIKYKWRSK